MKEQTPNGPARGLAILIGLNRTGRHMYGGTVPPAEVERRRAKNKAAKRARRMNRRGGAR